MYLIPWEGALLVCEDEKEEKLYLLESLLTIFMQGGHDNKFKSNRMKFQLWQKRCKYSDSSATITFFAQDMECVIMLLGIFWLQNHVS